MIVIGLDIGSEYSQRFTIVYKSKTEAYANMAKTYNSLTPPIDPSRTGLVLDIASSANGGYSKK